MIMISARENFWSTTEIAATDAIRDVNLLDPNPTVDLPLDEPDYLSAIAGKRILLLVHGYNNDEDDVNRAYSIIERNLRLEVPAQHDLVVGYTWPSGNLRLGYPFARARAKAVAPRLQLWLRRSLGQARAVDLMCHSLGNLVTLRALTNMAHEGAPSPRNCYLLAAAVDNESIEKGEKYYAATQLCDRVYVFHTNKDAVLRFLFPLGETISFHLPDIALGFSGPEDVEDILLHSKNVKVVNCKRVIHGHGKYKDAIPMYRYINNEFSGEPARQFVTLHYSRG